MPPSNPGHTNGTAGAATPGGNGQPPQLSPRLERFLTNAMSLRRDFMKQFLDPRRNYDEECGHPAQTLSAYNYQELYDREPIACRVVELLPKESWQVSPSVFEDEDSETITTFEEAWDNLGKELWVEESHYGEEQGSGVLEYLYRADVLSGIGQYGVLLLGLDDGKDLAEPVKKGNNRKLLYLRCLPESLAQITQFEDDPTSPRFGLPTQYSVTFNDPREGQQSGVGATTSTQSVHWSRVIHVADVNHTAPTSEVYAVPRLRPVLNRIIDLKKLYGGSAEMYWKGAFPGVSATTQPQLGADVDVDLTEVKDELEQYFNGLQRFLYGHGLNFQVLSPTVVDPGAQIQVQLEAVCIKLGVPKRVFLGSERGELASSQDDAAWNDRLRQRQHGYITPRILVPFVNRLINLGVLPKPPKGYKVWWPDLTSQSQQEKATIAVTKTQALAQYVGGQVESLMVPQDYLTRILGLEEEEALAILENAAAAEEEQKREQELAQKAQAKLAALNPPPQPQPGQPPTQGGEPGAAPGVAQNPLQKSNPGTLGAKQSTPLVGNDGSSENANHLPIAQRAHVRAAMTLLNELYAEKSGWEDIALAANASHFATCERDEKGHCLPADGGALARARRASYAPVSRLRIGPSAYRAVVVPTR